MEGVLVAGVIVDRMAGVRSSLGAGDHVILLCEDVYEFSLALISPLRAQNDSDGGLDHVLCAAVCALGHGLRRHATSAADSDRPEEERRE